MTSLDTEHTIEVHRRGSFTASILQVIEAEREIRSYEYTDLHIEENLNLGDPKRVNTHAELVFMYASEIVAARTAACPNN